MRLVFHKDPHNNDKNSSICTLATIQIPIENIEQRKMQDVTFLQ